MMTSGLTSSDEMLESVSLEPSAANASAFDPSDAPPPIALDAPANLDYNDDDDDNDNDIDDLNRSAADLNASEKRPPLSVHRVASSGVVAPPVSVTEGPARPQLPEVRVFAPHKVGDGMHAYTAYSLAVGDGRPVARRYSDFKWLRDVLVHDEPLRVVPPVPGKSLTGRFNEQFVAVRCYELNQFMLGVMAHPVLSRHAAVHAFIADDGGAALDSVRAARGGVASTAAAATASAAAPASASTASTGEHASTTQRLGAFGSALWSAVSSLPAKVAKVTTAPPSEIDPYVDAATGRLHAMRAALAHVANASRRRAAVLVSEAGLEPAADGTVAPAVTAHVSGGASDVAAALLGLARSEAGHDARSAAAVSEVAATTQHQLSLMSQDAAETRTTLANPADYMARFCDAVNDVLQHRLSLLAAAHEAKQRVMTLHSGSHDIESDALVAARRDAEAADDAYENATAAVRDELESFFVANTRVVRAMLFDYAQAQMNVAMSSANNWKQVVLKMNDA